MSRTRPEKQAPRWPADNDAGILRVRPGERKEFLSNPHKGCATFRSFCGEPLVSRSGGFGGSKGLEYDEHYLPSTVAYFRWPWRVLEPAPGRFDWSVVEETLAGARAHGQTLQVRLMPHGHDEKSALPPWYQDRYPTVAGTWKPDPYVAAVYDGPEFLERWGNVVREFGRCFDGHGDLESVDIGFVGPWGEGAGDCSPEAIGRMIDVYRRAHPRTPLVAMLKHKRSDGRPGEGWRVDGVGDLGVYHGPDLAGYVTWNHMYDWYPRLVQVRGARDVWKTGPVVFETIQAVDYWHQSNWDVDFILRQMLKYHGTVFMPKSRPIPRPWRERLLAFCNDLGYRFVLRQFRCRGRVRRGSAFDWAAWVENVGVAPLYRRYSFALRLSQNGREWVHRSPADVREWLPGDAWLEESFPMPDGLRPGRARLDAGLVDPETGEPRVRFANEGVDDAGWLRLGEVEIA